MKYKCTNIIIGAGPAGLQLGYFFKKNNIKYIILEKNNICGSFFDTFPHSNKLISINKKYTGSDIVDFNLRHDWNSLLSDESNPLFTSYSSEYYPDKNDMVKYLNDFAKIHELNIIFNSTVSNVIKDTDNNYILSVTCNKKKITYMCEKLIIATGLSKMTIPQNIIKKYKKPIKHYGEYPKDYFKDPINLEKFKNKSLLILGDVNS